MHFSDWVSLSALAVSLLSLVVAARGAFLDRPRLTVTTKYYEASDYGPSRMHVALVNRGRRPVILRSIGGNDSEGHWSSTTLDRDAGGRRLAEHERYELTLTAEQTISSGPDEEYPFSEMWIEDSLGTRHKLPKSKEIIAKLQGKSAA